MPCRDSKCRCRWRNYAHELLHIRDTRIIRVKSREWQRLSFQVPGPIDTFATVWSMLPVRPTSFLFSLISLPLLRRWIARWMNANVSFRKKQENSTTTTRHYRIHSRTEALQIGPINDGGSSSRR